MDVMEHKHCHVAGYRCRHAGMDTSRDHRPQIPPGGAAAGSAGRAGGGAGRPIQTHPSRDRRAYVLAGYPPGGGLGAPAILAGAPEHPARSSRVRRGGDGWRDRYRRPTYAHGPHAAEGHTTGAAHIRATCTALDGPADRATDGATVDACRRPDPVPAATTSSTISSTTSSSPATGCTGSGCTGTAGAAPTDRHRSAAHLPVRAGADPATYLPPGKRPPVGGPDGVV
jgi:hypothetical protein